MSCLVFAFIWLSAFGESHGVGRRTENSRRLIGEVSEDYAVAKVVLPGNPQNATCLDGSPPGYYLRRGYGNGTNCWLLHLQGGGWCFNSFECLLRTHSIRGSSIVWPTEQQQDFSELLQLDGILSSSPTENPTFYNWNLAVILYCDGGAFAGSRFDAVRRQNTSMKMLGRLNLRAVLSDLLRRNGMRSAQKMVVSGCSAGAQAVAMASERLVQAFSPTLDLKFLMDGGFFIDAASWNGERTFRNSVIDGVALHQMDRAFPTNCRAKYKKSNATWHCFFPSYNLFFSPRPVLIINSMYDYVALELTVFNPPIPSNFTYTSCIRSFPSFANCSMEQRSAMSSYKSQLLQELDELKRAKNSSSSSSTGTAAPVNSFVVSSINHCSTIYSNYNLIRDASRRRLQNVINDWVNS